MPISAMPMPKLQMIRYFHAASSAAWPPAKPTRNVVASVVAEIPIQRPMNVVLVAATSMLLQNAPSKMKYVDVLAQRISSCSVVGTMPSENTVASRLSTEINTINPPASRSTSPSTVSASSAATSASRPRASRRAAICGINVARSAPRNGATTAACVIRAAPAIAGYRAADRRR